MNEDSPGKHDASEQPASEGSGRTGNEPGEGQGEGKTDREDLDRSLVSGLAWTGGLKWASQFFSWIGTVLVARLLTPEDFGLLGMALVYTGLVHLINEFGIGSAIVQRKELRDSQVSGLGGFSLAVGVFFFLISVALAGPVAAFFRDPRVKWVVIAVSFNFITNSVGSISRSLLARDLEFRVLAWIDGLKTVYTTIVTLVLAWLGFRYWSLVIGSVSSAMLTTAAVFWLRPYRPRWPRPFDEIASELAFGWNMVVSRVAWYTYSNADFTVVGRVLGTAALGAYNIGWTMASMPVEKISVMVMRVTPSIFARVQDDLPALRRYLNRLTEGISIFTFPAAIGLAIVARDFVVVFLGTKWLNAVVPLQLLALYVTFRSVATLYADVLIATDHTRMNMIFSMIGALVLPACFVAGSHWGTTGVALAWVVGYPVITIPFHVRTTFRIIELRPAAYFASMWPAASSTVVMAAAVLGVRSLLGSQASDVVRMSVSVAVGVVSYGGALWLIHRRRIKASLDFLRSLRARKAAAG